MPSDPAAEISKGRSLADIKADAKATEAITELGKEQLAELLMRAPAAIAMLSGPEHRWSFVNDQYLQAVGRSQPDELLGRAIRETLPELEEQGFVELLDKVYDSGQPFAAREARVVLERADPNRSNESFWDFVYQPLRDDAGKVHSILVHAVEATERVAARRAIDRVEQRFRAIVETTPECVKVVRRDGTLLHMNAVGLQLVGATRTEDVVGKDVYGLIAPEDRARFQDFNERICAGERGALTFDIVGLNGVRRHMESHAAPMPDENGSWVQLAVTRDISMRQKAEEAQRRLAAIVESSDDAIASKDLNGIVTSWNKSAERLFGYKAAEIVGRPITMVIPPELHRDEDMILSKIRRGEVIDHFETVRVTKSGDRIEVSLTISPVKNEDGKVIGAAKIVRNITENKKIERALRTTEKLAAAGRLAATVAHEINNPLTAVTNLIYLATTDLPDVTKVAEHLQLAARELNRVAHITRQTLGFYRDTSAPTRFSVTQTLDDLLVLYEKRLEAQGITLVRQYDRDVQVTALAGEIRQAFSNLITNAIDAMPTGGTFAIRVTRGHSWADPEVPGVRISICDTGSGIEPRHRKNIFQPFFTTKSAVGTGLGLWITRNIVEKHEGSIRVRSKISTNHGSVFSIFLPLDAQSSVWTRATA